MKRIILFFCMLSLVFIPAATKENTYVSQSTCGSVDLTLTPAFGTYEDEIQVNVNISNNQCGMTSLGFDFFYDTSMFSYLGVEAQNCLTADWSMIDGYEVSPGQIRIGGYSGSGTEIQSTDNGCLVRIRLQVVTQCTPGMDGQQSTLTIDAYIDDMETYVPQPAQTDFTLICCCGEISLPLDMSGTWGDLISIPVDIANNESQICDFEFDFVYDSSVFELNNVQRSAVIQDWTTLNWNQVEPGRMRISGAVGSGTCISTSSFASLVTINMMVECVGYTVDTLIPMRLENYNHGIACLCARTFEADFLYAACPRMGDVNASTTITPADAQAAFEIYLGRIQATLEQLTTADANCGCPCDNLQHIEANHCITPQDAQWIFEHYLGRRVLPLCCADYECPQSSPLSVSKPFVPAMENQIVYPLPTIGISGERVQIPVMVNDPFGIRNFGLELTYPQELLEYMGVLASPLTQEFDSVSGEEIFPGVIKVQGDAETGILSKDKGSICVAVFRVREEMSGSAPIELHNLNGDIHEAEVKKGNFMVADYRMDEERSVTLGKYREKKGRLVLPVKVTNAFDMKAFGLELRYSTDKLTFVGVEKSKLTKDFVAVDGNELENGIIRIGGFGMSGIQKRIDGTLVKLVFEINAPGGEVEIIKLDD